MPISFDGTQVPGSLPQMPCGGTPLFDVDSGYAYFCDTCFAIIGSVSQPDACVEINNQYNRDTNN